MNAALDAPDALGRLLLKASAGCAIIGGLVLIAGMVMSIVSIAGRVLFSQPVPGDYELVEIGCAVAVFAFLPYCQMVRGNVIVDFFTAHASSRLRSALDTIGNALYTVIAALLTWRTVLGGLELKANQETTLVLQTPIWWGFVPATLALVLLTLVCAYSVGRSVRELRRG
ncbi:MAG: TRAP transporter small permease [Gammaproteobacteria bacterium]